MTRTDPPDILVSTLYRDIHPNPITPGHSLSLSTYQQCDSQMIDTPETINKRHCRSFDFESLDDPQSLSASMEYPPYRRPPDHEAASKHVDWNGSERPGHLRFSSPDLFNARQQHPPPQHTNADKASRNTTAARPDPRRTRSRSVPRVKSTLTPVPISVSPPPAARTLRGRGAPQAAADPPRSMSETPRESYSSSRPFLNEVHPIKLQPHSPLFVSDCFEEPAKPAAVTTPHVRCRVDIKPDAAVLQHTTATRRVPVAGARTEHAWPRYPPQYPPAPQTNGSRGLYVPRQTVASSSPTPTPSECYYSGDFRQGYQYSAYSGIPPSYTHPLDMHRTPSPTMPREYLGRDQRAYSNPNIPTKFFYTTEDPVRYSVHPSSARAYYHDDRSSVTSQASTLNSHYNMHDPRSSRWAHTLPVRPYYADHMSSRDSVYGRPYSTTPEARPYFTQTPQARSPYYGGEDSNAYSIYHPSASRVYYTKPYNPPPAPAEQYIPVRAYHTEGLRHPRLSQAYTDDWYRSSISGYSNQSSQLTPQRARPDTWFTNGYVEPARLGAEARSHSRSWDNILYPRHDSREQAVQRGRSYDNLFYQARRSVPPAADTTAEPVIVNLSSSPRRYAALSLSETSLERGGAHNPGRNAAKGGIWFVTPEITITDNDIRAAGARKQRDTRGGPVGCWDAPDREKTQPPPPAPHHDSAETTKDRKHNSYSLQQSLEQLDELLADLVIDYKPPTSRRPSEDLLDQLKLLISDEDEKGKRASSPGVQSPGLLNTQNTFSSTKTSPDGGGGSKDPDSGCDALQRSAEEECSPDHSTDDDNDAMVCANRKCKRSETLFNACLYFKSCHSCYTFYCSRNCRRDDWDSHKGSCLYGRITSVCRHALKYCRENQEIHKAFSRVAKAGYLSRGRGVLFLGFANPGTADNFLQVGLESLLMSPTYLSLRELDGFQDNLGEYCKELQQAGDEYDPGECFLLNVSIAVGELMPNRPSPRIQTPTVRKYAKVSLASSSPDKKLIRKESDMETLILTPPPGTPDIDKEGEEGRKAREICFINIQRELRTRGVFLRHEYAKVYRQLCEFVESNKRFTPTTIYPIDKRTGKQFMCMIMAASEPRTLGWVGTPHLLDDII